MKTIIRHIFLMLIIVATASCGNDGPGIPVSTQTTISCRLGDKLPTGTISNLVVKFTEVNTGNVEEKALTVDADNKAFVDIQVGYYRIDATATLDYNDLWDGHPATTVIRAYNGGVTISASTTEIPLEFFNDGNVDIDTRGEYSGFVLAEIFCAGSSTPYGTYYYADKYFVIYNNSDKVQYADSLIIAESDFLTTYKQNYTPDIMATDFAVNAMYMIPGNGHDVPVQPGGKIIIVDNALDHTQANPNSWDETSADYEWYDESLNPSYSDVDNPNVPNLVKIYANTLTMWSPHTQGFRSYVLGRMHTDIDSYLFNYTYDYEYTIVGATGEAQMTGYSYRLPNHWIIDAVNCSVPSGDFGGFQWIVTAPELDRGYTYCAEFGWDDSRYNKSMRRKVVSVDNGRAILQDTNNSSDDFQHRAKADPYYDFSTGTFSK